MKSLINHPSTYLPKDSADTIRNVAGIAEAQRTLHDDQLLILYREKWLNLFVPKEYGGLELSLPDVLRIEEGLAWADGSTAWVTTLCSGAAWFVGFLDPAVTKKVFADSHVCFAGSGMPTGIAEITPTGYEINGYWKYASGSHHATVFTANCMIQKNGTPLYHDDGTVVVRSFLFLRSEVTLHDTWNSMGMIATGSHSFEVKNLTIPKNRSFVIDPKHATINNALYRYPFLQLAETTLVVNLSGMAMRFIDLCEELFKHKHITSSMPDLHQALLRAKAKLDEYRQQFYNAIETSWQTCINGIDFSQNQLQHVSGVCHALAHHSRQLVNDLYPYCGLVAADTREEINRVWRNIHTASQHALFSSRRLGNPTVL